ncbi:PUA domain containing protein [Methanosalsum zhilinae DSM 4017]|uniref:PUA domain containing protein n=1 Tax=Methanosalsum zhilinae (strain DSM 4017 / NBRC 107636 / OCM 62 / WeN5) TaxID=679901 RepID=F7XPZ7_METZD|nr:PUA domain-containing protein [Methanosalsum zhilinae]AEH61524.1 PUA domain containing protein [Methanosalsum zhilinae DSM 4017]
MRSEKNLKRIRIMADYQFGKGSGGVLFEDDVSFQFSKTKRVRQVLHQGERIATVRARDSMFTLSIKGAALLHSHLSYPGMRVVVNADAVPFVSAGKTAFAKHVIEIDPDLRVGEEVLVVDESDNLLATGQLLVTPQEVHVMEKGGAVDVRQGIL